VKKSAESRDVIELQVLLDLFEVQLLNAFQHLEQKMKIVLLNKDF